MYVKILVYYTIIGNEACGLICDSQNNSQNAEQKIQNIFEIYHMTNVQWKQREEQHKRYKIEFNKYITATNVLRECII
jgi:hypothetical protein